MDRKLDSIAYYQRGRNFYDCRQHDKSMILCKRALTTKSDYCDAHFRWGLNLLRIKANDKAAIKYKEVISRDPTNCMAYYNLGVTFERQDKLFDAETQYKMSIRINPSYKRAAYNLAIVLTKQMKYTEALEQKEKNIRDDVEISSTYNSYGYLKLILGEYEEAIKSFDEAINRGSEDSLPFFNKCLAFSCLGKSDLAVETLRESFDQLRGSRDWQQMLQSDVLIYNGELSRFEKLFEDDNLGEINREQLSMNIKVLGWIVNLLNQELSNSLNKEESYVVRL